MGTITTTDGTEIFYKDWGSGQPIVFSHGWPLSADDWDTQMMFFLLHGYRVVAHDISISATPSTSVIRLVAARWCAIWPGTARAGWRGRC
jgi:pimeloyl-ACP methyl ester carboxylesterase